VTLLKKSEKLLKLSVSFAKGPWTMPQPIPSAALAPYASLAEASKGRFHRETLSPLRTPFQRDRDRIIHSGAFRKLRNKTQVFVEFEGDFYRTRLTHSLEVAQIAGTICRALRLDEDLAEAVALAHDLGHTCFGHCGEEALDRAMQPYGGFSHNDQTLRILTQLETRVPEFGGLNLTWETIEAVTKHNGPLGNGTGRKVSATIAAINHDWDLELTSYCGLEGQIAALADDIAYNTHDVDDGVRAGILPVAEIAELPLFSQAILEARDNHPAANKAQEIQIAVRQVIGMLVDDLLQTTRRNLEQLQPQSVADIRAADQMIAALSPAMQENLNIIHAYLLRRMYRDPAVNRFNVKADKIVTDLFAYYLKNPECLPSDWQAPQPGQSAAAREQHTARQIADYIAGMTDRYAVLTWQKAFSIERFI
jgi:dGTPase